MQFKLLSTIAEINPRLPEGNYEDDLMVSFIPMANLEAEIGIINLSLEKKYSQVRKGYTSFIDGDVIFAKITPCMENGKSGLVQKLKNGIGFGSTEFHVIRPSQQVLGKYLFYYVVQRSFRNEARKFMTGSAGQLRVPANYLKNILIPLPPLPEQQRIVARIEELFSELDNGIQNLKTAQAQLKTYRQAVLKAAFEGKLSEEWRKNNATDKSNSDLKQKVITYHQTRASRKKNHDLDVSFEESYSRNIPVSWIEIKLKYLSNGVEYGTSDKSEKSGKVPVLRMGNIQNFRFDYSNLVYSNNDTEIKKYQLHKNDVLFNRTNSPELVGKTAIYKLDKPAIFAGYLIRINQIESLINADYLNYFLNSIKAKNYANEVKTDGVNQSNINGNKLINYVIPYCSLEEQNIIVAELETRLSISDKIEATINQSLQQAESLRQSILKQAFEGNLI